MENDSLWQITALEAIDTGTPACGITCHPKHKSCAASVVGHFLHELSVPVRKVVLIERLDCISLLDSEPMLKASSAAPVKKEVDQIHATLPHGPEFTQPSPTARCDHTCRILDPNLTQNHPELLNPQPEQESAHISHTAPSTLKPKRQAGSRKQLSGPQRPLLKTLS